MRTLAFFNNKGGVGKTTLVYHLAHMWADLGERVLLVDFDPQANLTSMCLSEETLEEIWTAEGKGVPTVYRAIEPIKEEMGDVSSPDLIELRDGLALIPGDMALSLFEERLSVDWGRALDRKAPALRALSAFHRLAHSAAEQYEARLVIFDVGPNLGAINRTALLSVDDVITPLAPDLFSMQGLRNLGPALARWREEWSERRHQNEGSAIQLPPGRARPCGYILMQAGMRLRRPVKAYQRWVERMPGEYYRALLGREDAPDDVEGDRYCLGVMRHYQSLMPLAQEAHKPMFHLRAGDGALGAHLHAVERCGEEFRSLASRIEENAASSVREPTGGPTRSE